jgi:hypothetical protein
VPASQEPGQADLLLDQVFGNGLGPLAELLDGSGEKVADCTDEGHFFFSFFLGFG